ncbi:MAG TPA: carbohydrate ABC transporter permease [Actinocrinis sp.]|jgi:multiple sugar transport system permease protein|uniref:carbohydrate ABC transporter permease n=1 Tax=Actinocrinis sp. TaxID=1920516 RepID=UPI002DDCE860|nr:carbohydrate ABC transporter permease [Actinocrinis sp.]HEV3170196.1 carbohydrate ABC transporter permease [Actinocrinis sp.]
MAVLAPAPPLPSAGIRRTHRAAARRRRILEWIAVHSLAIVAAVFFAGPFFLMLVTSLMPDNQALSGALWPAHWQWSNFRAVWDRAGFLTWYRNTLLYAVPVTVLTVVSSVPVAYAMAKFKYRFRRTTLILLVSAMMIPPQVTVMPMYLLWTKQFGLGGTLWPLIVPTAFGDAYSIFLLRQFLLTVPKEYLDAARVDGCGEIRTLIKVVVPMIRPAIAAVALFQFFYAWNDYFGPQVYVGPNPGSWTLALGLETFHAAHHVDWNLMMAANLMVIAPIVIIFFFAQKVFVEGVTLTGVKG